MRGRCKFDDALTYRMPVHFVGYPYNPELRVLCKQVRMLSVEQQTDIEALAEIIPEQFEILQPCIQWSYCDLHEVDFLANGEYRILQAAVPVKWVGGGACISGVYPLIIYENHAIPILGGREEDGMPKVFCDISSLHHFEKHWWAAASFECETILKLDYHENVCDHVQQQSIPKNKFSAKYINFGNRSIPNVGRGGMAHHDYIAYPQEYCINRTCAGSAELSILPLDAWYKNPGMFRVLSKLDSLPKLGFQNALLQDGTITMCVADSFVLEVE